MRIIPSDLKVTNTDRISGPNIGIRFGGSYTRLGDTLRRSDARHLLEELRKI